MSIAGLGRQTVKQRKDHRSCRQPAAKQRVRAGGEQTSGSSQTDTNSQQQSSQELTNVTNTQRSQPPALPPQKNDDNLLAGVLEEVNLIEWPKFTQALRDTFVVIGIVGALSVLLFITNSSFTELSRFVYKS
ncbi:hypothetical protein WJX74_007930 [Apatococcus lobatus]|uniref:Preprotein translocase subunit SecE n=1 Tax=Apatococcus lobatus TaxID=904363 RepID=A0AAW1RXS2_9CHLO